jgi:oligopeptide transport system substrate-binding protein
LKTAGRLFSCLLPVVLAGCAPRQTAVEAGDRGQVLHRGVGYEVAALDPQVTTGTAEVAILTELFEGLVSENPRDLHPVPGVASGWETSADGLVTTFKLRADARWSDGRPVTAADFVASWRRILTPSLGAPYAGELHILKGAADFNTGRTRDFATVGVAALDDHRLRITLDHPVPGFLSRLATLPWLPVPTATIAASGDPFGPGNPWAQEGRIVGNGPFLLKSWRRDSEIVVVKSPTYWGAASVRLNEIHFHPIDSLDAEERAFRAGQLHVTDAIPLARIDEYRRTSPQLLRIDPYLGTYFYRLNVRRPGLADPRVRRALSLSVDRAAIVARLLRGGQSPAAAFCPPGMPGYRPPPGAGTDFAGARRLLALSGHAGGAGLPELELLYNNSESHRIIAEAIQETWRRELGVGVRLVNQEAKAVMAARESGDYDILRSSWIADYPDPASFLDLWRTHGGNNDTGWSSPAYDSLLSRAERAADPAERNSLYRQAEALLLDAAPVIPIYYYTHVFLIRPSVRGWYPNSLDHHPCRYVWLSGGG